MMSRGNWFESLAIGFLSKPKPTTLWKSPSPVSTVLVPSVLPPTGIFPSAFRSRSHCSTLSFLTVSHRLNPDPHYSRQRVFLEPPCFFPTFPKSSFSLRFSYSIMANHFFLMGNLSVSLSSGFLPVPIRSSLCTSLPSILRKWTSGINSPLFNSF